MTKNTGWHLDASSADADWTKQTWDLGGVRNILHVLKYVIGAGWPKDRASLQAALDEFMGTPAGKHMPQPHRERLRKMGYTVPEGGPDWP